MGPIVDAAGVTKVYRTGAVEVPALNGINLSIEPGEFVAVMGPSGCGKTTLLNCLSGLDDIDEGSVMIDGSDIHKMKDGDRTEHRAGRMGFIFQSFNLIPVLSAVENVELPLLLSGVEVRRGPRAVDGDARPGRAVASAQAQAQRTVGR